MDSNRGDLASAERGDIELTSLKKNENPVSNVNKNQSNLDSNQANKKHNQGEEKSSKKLVVVSLIVAILITAIISIIVTSIVWAYGIRPLDSSSHES